MTNLKLRSPWVLHHRKLEALFGKDDGVKVELDESSTRKKFVLRVESQRKATALERVLPSEVSFGGVDCDIVVVPGNKAGDPLSEDAPMVEVMKAAFEGNGSCALIRQVSKGLFRDLVYVVFAKEVVQYEADNLADVNGNMSTLMEEIARDVMTGAEGALFCTSACGGGLAAGESLDKPLGEWP